MDTFQLRPDLPKVLEITFLHTDFGLGRFTPSMRGPDILSILYLTWLTIWGWPETCLTDGGSEVENDAFINALQSMGIPWRAAPTEAPWGIGCSERLHGPIRDAFLRILAETPTLATDLALAMAYKARNDAPRANGASPTPPVTSDPPRLIIGPNHHADPSMSARARAMHAARHTMEKYTAADRLRGALPLPPRHHHPFRRGRPGGLVPLSPPRLAPRRRPLPGRQDRLRPPQRPAVLLPRIPHETVHLTLPTRRPSSPLAPRCLCPRSYASRAGPDPHSLARPAPPRFAPSPCLRVPLPPRQPRVRLAPPLGRCQGHRDRRVRQDRLQDALAVPPRPSPRADLPLPLARHLQTQPR